MVKVEDRLKGNFMIRPYLKSIVYMRQSPESQLQLLKDTFDEKTQEQND